MMLSIFNEQYFIDIDKVDEYVQIEQGKKEIPVNEKNVDDHNGNTISIVKYELLKLMLEVVMDGEDVVEIKQISTEINKNFQVMLQTKQNTVISSRPRIG